MQEGMTNEQFNTVLKMIVEIIKSSESKEDAIKKIEALTKQSKLLKHNLGGTCHRLYHFHRTTKMAKRQEKDG